jgi:hypothetical protein
MRPTSEILGPYLRLNCRVARLALGHRWRLSTWTVAVSRSKRLSITSQFRPKPSSSCRSFAGIMSSGDTPHFTENSWPLGSPGVSSRFILSRPNL